MSKMPSFQKGDQVVYPTHGVGKIVDIEQQEFSGMKIELYVISFAKDKMTLRVPTAKAHGSGLRFISSEKDMENALKTLRKRNKPKKTMWSRRAQEYEAKINSGDPVSIAEVVRDLHRHDAQIDQSYSERQMYKAALDRLAGEFAAVESIDSDTAVYKLEELLSTAA